MIRGVLNYLVFVLVIIAQLKIRAQDLEKIGKKDMLTINGGLNVSSVVYHANGISNRRQPFTYFVNGNVTGNVLGISLPFTFNYSNNQITYSQPYNIQSFNPTYKWIKGYAGITAMNFSQYTQNGHVFAGGGVELTPKNFKFGALYGRFKKATPFDFENNSDMNMAYKRMGWGGYAGYGRGGHEIKFIYFAAEDDANSLAFVPLNTQVAPMRNAVVSAVGKTVLFKKLMLEAEYALSGITRNLQSNLENSSAPKNKLPYLFSTNPSSQFFEAYKAGIAYNLKLFRVAFNYERVAPEYKTLGAYFFNNDLENFTLAPSATLWKGKLSLAANTGLQRNNLNGDKLSTTKRWVGALNAAYAPNTKWNFNANYSNFSAFTRQRPQDNPFYKNNLDTLNFYQLTQNAGFGVTHQFASTAVKHVMALTTSYQVTGQDQGRINDANAFGINQTIGAPAKVVNGNLSHNMLLTQSKISLGLVLNGNYSEQQGFYTLFAGPGVVASKGF
jgi:hypothetical protein